MPDIHFTLTFLRGQVIEIISRQEPGLLSQAHGFKSHHESLCSLEYVTSLLWASVFSSL